ncbi:OB-fold domain-containing protein [Streptomyces qinzhouensis]|uniref:OB-fold domain-containing protein n=1 Tax=Streptomyces qinzhouensis TaxID=2599401 RepID=UPI001FE38C54|nr:OB-fold domain-containing protein [Streptomyces qinzhouensis]
MSPPEGDLYERLKGYEGRVAVAGGAGKDPVNPPMIRHWCEAMGDTNPAYQGPGAVAPPTMLQAWTLGGLSGHGPADSGEEADSGQRVDSKQDGRDGPDGQDGRDGPDGGRSAAWQQLLGLLDGAGYTSVVATDCEQEYRRPLRPGDRITFDTVIESVSERKRTKLGTGHFITTRMDVRVAGGEPVGTHRFRILKYAPGNRRPRDGSPRDGSPRDGSPGVGSPGVGSPGDGIPGVGSPRVGGSEASTAGTSGERGARRPRPVVNRDNAGFWDGVAERRLLIQRCTACGRLRFPWLPGCNDCGSDAWDTVEAGGTGSVYSYVVMHHPPFPAFDPPYAVGLIELAEGVRIVAGVTGVPPDEVRIGMPVELEFTSFEEDLTLPVFRVVTAPGMKGNSENTRESRTGDEFPPLEIPITRTLIVSGAVASRDFQDVHHDAESARRKGSPDIFMNILTTNGLVGRYVTDCLGERAELRKVAIRLGVPNYPGDTMVLRGTVVSVTDATPEPPVTRPGLPGPGQEPGPVAVKCRTAQVRIVGTNTLGHHVTGLVTVALPTTETAADKGAEAGGGAGAGAGAGRLVPGVGGGGGR